jgi:DNA-binding protein WhiA
MSVSERMREELARVEPPRRCCRLAEVSAIFHTAGAWHLSGEGISVELDLAGGIVARRAFVLLRALGARPEIRTYRRPAFDRATRYQLRLSAAGAVRAVLREAGVLTPSGAPLPIPPKRIVGRSCCRGAYVRGALLGAGSFSGPRTPHLEIRLRSPEAASFVMDVARREEIGLQRGGRRGEVFVYAKRRETIAGVLALAGASDVALLLEEHAVLAATRAEVNRLSNADAANLGRTARAAHRQLAAIRVLDVDALTDPLAEMARLRRRNPTASIGELAAKADPPVTKAAAQRRLEALVRLAEES